MLGVIVWAIISGTVLGILGRLLLKGKQDIPWWATIGAGIVGGAIADALGVGDTEGIDWIKHAIQVGVAVIAVAVTTALMGGRGKSSRAQ